MALVPVVPPALEPITLAEAKAHLRVSDSSEDLLIASLITAARVHLELVLASAFITQTWSWFLDAWPRRVHLDMPLSPVQSVAAVRVLVPGDTQTTLAPASYLLTSRSNPSRLTLKQRSYWANGAPEPAYAADGIEIEFTAGFGPAAADVPAPLRQALLLLIAHWFEDRAPVEIGHVATELPLMVAELIAPYRQVRL